MSHPRSALITNNQYLVQHETFKYQTNASILSIDHLDNYEPHYWCVRAEEAEIDHVIVADRLGHRQLNFGVMFHNILNDSVLTTVKIHTTHSSYVLLTFAHEGIGVV